MKVFLFGATGSIGQQCLKVIKQLGYELVGYTYHSNEDLANLISLEYGEAIKLCTKDLKDKKTIFRKILSDTNPSLVINAITGFAGLEATIAAIESRIDVALANKESLVVAGNIIIPLAKANKVRIIPIDSEHSALMQLYLNFQPDQIKQVAITASGGRYYNATAEELKKVSYNEAIKHPKWKMGAKISLDSATLVNKYFELIEAYWYFPHLLISAFYHPEVKIHALVETNDGWYGQVSDNNMEISIRLALTGFKDTSETSIIKVDDFKEPYLLQKIDESKHLPIKWFSLSKANVINITTIPIIVNAANDYAQDLFKKDIITFDKIIKIITWAIEHIKIEPCQTFDDVVQRNVSIVKQLKKEFE